MGNKTGGIDCTWGSFLMAAIIGVFMAVVMRFFAGLSWPGSIFVAVLAFIVLGLLFVWIFCRELPALGETTAPTAGTAGSGSSTGASTGTTTAAPAAVAATSAAPAAKADDTSTVVAAEETPSAPEAAAKDYDGDGVVEGTGEGKRPEALSAARDGQADNLKEIKGIGPKLEKLCNSLGFYHFDQIANWTADEVAWVDSNLEGFKGRVTRDNWVSQAKILAAGGETEFSKRVEDGDVY